jgi:hypothetical protein
MPAIGEGSAAVAAALPETAELGTDGSVRVAAAEEDNCGMVSLRLLFS